MTGFDWPALMHAGLHGLKLSPDTFWRLTPADFDCCWARARAPHWTGPG